MEHDAWRMIFISAFPDFAWKKFLKKYFASIFIDKNVICFHFE